MSEPDSPPPVPASLPQSEAFSTLGAPVATGASAPSPLSILIAGGGITGLTLAYKLTAAGRTKSGRPIRVTVLEARDRLGGNIRTEKHEGFVIDGGPDAWVITKPQASALARELGLGDRLIGTKPENRRVLVLDGDELYPFPEGMFLTIPTKVWPFLKTGLLSTTGKLRAGFDFLLPRRTDTDDESIASFVRRRFGDNVLQKLGEPLLGGVYAGDVEALSIHSTFPQLVEIERKHRSLILGARHMIAARAAHAPPPPRGAAPQPAPSPGGRKVPPSPFHSFPGGVAELVNALISRIEKAGGELRTGVKIERVRQGANGAFEAEIQGPQGSVVFPADRLILATQAYAAADAIAELVPDAAATLREMPYISSAVAGLAYRKADIDRPLDMTGLVTTQTTPRPIVAITILSSKWDGRAPDGSVLFRVFFGGHGHEAILENADGALLDIAHAQIKDLFGAKKDPLFGRIYRHNRASAQPTVGHAARLARIQASLAKRPGLSVVGAAMDGVGIPDCVRQANELAAQILAS